MQKSRFSHDTAQMLTYQLHFTYSPIRVHDGPVFGELERACTQSSGVNFYCTFIATTAEQLIPLLFENLGGISSFLKKGIMYMYFISLLFFMNKKFLKYV